MDYTKRMEELSKMINLYKENKDEELLKKILSVLKYYINKTSIRIFNRVDEDISSEVIIELLSKWINKEHDNIGKYVVNRLIYHITDLKFYEHCNKGLSWDEKHEVRKLYLKKNKTQAEQDRYDYLQSNIVYLDYVDELPEVESNVCLFEDIKEMLSTDEYFIIYSIYKEKQTLSEIAEKLNISKQAVDKKHKKILEKLKDELTEI